MHVYFAGFLTGLAVAVLIYEYSLRALNRTVKANIARLKAEADGIVYKGRQ